MQHQILLYHQPCSSPRSPPPASQLLGTDAKQLIMDELEELKNDMEVPLETLLQQKKEMDGQGGPPFTTGSDADDDGDMSEVEDFTGEESDENEEFVGEDEQDDETTLIEEEKLGRDITVEEEVSGSIDTSILIFNANSY